MKPILLKKLFFIALFGFLLNLAWEVSHSLLYKTVTDMTVEEYVPRILRASAGDIVMILVIFFTISSINHSLTWRLNRRNIFFSIIFGIIIAVTFELYAQYTQRFEYNLYMPLIPFLRVGITPVLQMIFAPLASFFLSERIH